MADMKQNTSALDELLQKINDLPEPTADPKLRDVTITPSEQRQEVTAGAGYDGISKAVVEPIPNTYVGTAVTRKAAATYTPTESTQSIAANQYLSGVQTIAAIPSTYVGTAADANIQQQLRNIYGGEA